MISVDTNIVVRLLTGDDPGQYQKARRLFEQETVFLPDTVILETAWVLRHTYGFDPSSVVNAFRSLLGLSNVRTEDPRRLDQAFGWIEQGLALPTPSIWLTVSLRMLYTHLTKIFPNGGGTWATVQ